MQIHKKLLSLVATKAVAQDCKVPDVRKQLAEKCDVSPDFVYQWCEGIRPIPAAHAIPIEEFFEGALTRQQIAPKVFRPELTEKSAA